MWVAFSQGILAERNVDMDEYSAEWFLRDRKMDVDAAVEKAVTFVEWRKTADTSPANIAESVNTGAA